MRVFLSYRREDTAAHAGRLADGLRRRLGRSDVFIDVAGIQAGSEFDAAIAEAIGRSDAVLVVIGPRWLSARDADGRPRLTDPQDYVRREVAGALARSLRVVPVLVGGATLPSGADVPDDLVPLVRRQAVSLDDATWQRDVDALVDVLRGRQAERPRRRAWPLVVGGVLVGAAAATAVVLLLRPDTGGGDGETAVLASCPDADDGWTRLLGPGATASGRVDEGDAGSLDFTVTDVFAQAREDGRWEVVITSELANNLGELREHGDWVYDQLEVDRQPYEQKTCFSVEARYPEPGQRSRGRVGFEVGDDPAKGLRLVVQDSDYSRDFTLTTAASP
ncbi:toll/interleukin-1 receptor domain-containing protein [Georgenia subflava]|uniref:TIR domain-containing protein n=1 Tax=Georgenia subflava TaxID=1622177 RepID=A0A6N7EGA3_9MICO|nr:toll/interleukin-1 receptor domain-containing protein [Georgenia subflava]MPV35685.1 TIR domain-containing protein [Georgenia subflava]